jgi:hypothetical protein
MVPNDRHVRVKALPADRESVWNIPSAMVDLRLFVRSPHFCHRASIVPFPKGSLCNSNHTHVLLDPNRQAEAIERGYSGKPTGRHFLCPRSIVEENTVALNNRTADRHRRVDRALQPVRFTPAG